MIVFRLIKSLSSWHDYKYAASNSSFCVFFQIITRYFINLTGQEFPLKTNAEIVEILKALKGANNMDGTFKR